jgi:serine/threonine protein kinase
MTSIHYLHRKKIAHRDIKPENLLIDSNFRIKLCDFGWSNVISKKNVRKSVCGTYEYMPPEVVNEQPQTLKADLWSLGILLYEMLHGKAPFRANSLDEIKNKIEKQQIYLNSQLSKETKDIVKLLLRRDSTQRCSAEEILGFMAHNYEIQKFEEKISEDDKFLLFKNYYYNKYKITNEEVIRSKMVLDSLTMKEKQENNKMPFKYNIEKQLNKKLIAIVDNLGKVLT